MDKKMKKIKIFKNSGRVFLGLCYNITGRSKMEIMKFLKSFLVWVLALVFGSKKSKVEELKEFEEVKEEGGKIKTMFGDFEITQKKELEEIQTMEILGVRSVVCEFSNFGHAMAELRKLKRGGVKFDISEDKEGGNIWVTVTGQKLGFKKIKDKDFLGLWWYQVHKFENIQVLKRC